MRGSHGMFKLLLNNINSESEVYVAAYRHKASITIDAHDSEPWSVHASGNIDGKPPTVFQFSSL